VALVAGDGLPSAERDAAEDDAAAGRRAVEALAVSAADAVVGVSASGRTPYTVAALEAAAGAGALTVALTAVEESELARGVDHELAVVVGPRVRRGLDETQGRHGAEAGPEHDLDGRDDPARQDLRRPDGRRPLVEREARGPRAQGVRLAAGRLRRGGRARARGGGRQREGREWSLCSPASTRRRRANGWSRPPGTCGRRSSNETRRRSRADRRELVPGDVDIADGEIAAYGLSGGNGRGCIAVPGFVDLQVNGFGGVDFMGADADGYARGGEALLETGVTAYLPTFISAPEEDLLAALGNVPSIRPAHGCWGSTSKGRSSRRSASASTRARPGAIQTRRCWSACSARGRSG
jgi:hypothetical protein